MTPYNDGQMSFFCRFRFRCAEFSTHDMELQIDIALEQDDVLSIFEFKRVYCWQLERT
jgi:hypothetical protein